MKIENENQMRQLKPVKITTSIFLIGIFIFIVNACSKEQPKVGTLDGEPITVKEFEAYMALKRIPKDDSAEVERTRDVYLERAALARAIEKKKFLNAEQMKVELEEFKKEMLIGRYFEKYLNEQVTDKAVANYYKMHQSDYEVKKVHTAHILVRTSKKMTETEKQAQRTKIQDAYTKLKTGEPFDAVAKEYSEDKISAKKGGDLGWLEEGAVHKTFSQKVFETRKGEITEIFDTPFGYHIVTVLDEARVSKVPLERVAGKIRYQLRDEAKKAEMERLQKSVKVETSKFSLAKPKKEKK